MNAKELIELGDDLTTLNDANLAQRVIDGTSVQNFIYGTIDALSATIPHETAVQAPIEADGDKEGYVIAYRTKFGWMLRHWQDVVDNAEAFIFWLPMPETPKEKGKEDV